MIERRGQRAGPGPRGRQRGHHIAQLCAVNPACHWAPAAAAASGAVASDTAPTTPLMVAVLGGLRAQLRTTALVPLSIRLVLFRRRGCWRAI